MPIKIQNGKKYEYCHECSEFVLAELGCILHEDKPKALSAPPQEKYSSLQEHQELN